MFSYRLYGPLNIRNFLLDQFELLRDRAFLLYFGLVYENAPILKIWWNIIASQARSRHLITQILNFGSQGWLSRFITKLPNIFNSRLWRILSNIVLRLSHWWSRPFVVLFQDVHILHLLMPRFQLGALSFSGMYQGWLPARTLFELWRWNKLILTELVIWNRVNTISLTHINNYTIFWILFFCRHLSLICFPDYFKALLYTNGRVGPCKILRASISRGLFSFWTILRRLGSTLRMSIIGTRSQLFDLNRLL